MDKPNILIFMTDQQRGDTIPPYSRAKTPNLDRFCKEGITFSKTYTVAPHCCPARATFFSGLYPSQHGVWNNVNVGNTLSRGLYQDVKLFSENLKEAGYHMVFSGKWHVSAVESPLHRGFDVMNIPKPGDKKELRHEKPSTHDWNRYFKIKETIGRSEAQILREGYPVYTHYGVDENPFKDNDVVKAAVENIRSHTKSQQPWCRFIGTLGPHDPYFLPQKYLDMYSLEDISLPASYTDTMADKPGLYRKTRDKFNQLGEREQKEAIRHYLAFCTYEDALFGEVLNALEESGEADNTLVLYVSDHGDYLAEHGLWCKGLPCFRGAYHIPAAIRWPVGIKNPGRVVDEYVTLADFAPTFLEACGVEADREYTGQSLLPFINDVSPTGWRDAVFTQTNGNELYGIQRSVMTKEWKYIYNGFDYDELYNLKADPDETTNLIHDSGYSSVVRELGRMLWEFAYNTGDVCVNPYVTVSLAAYGPGIIFQDGKQDY